MSKLPWTWELFWERAVSVFKYLIAIYMMFAGLVTPFMSVAIDHLGWLYSSPVSLTIAGTIIFCSGLWLFLGKVRRNRKQVGQGLMMCFCCFIFSGVLNSLAFVMFDPGNFIAAGVIAILYLRWRFKTAYIDPEHFRTDAHELNEHNRLS